MKLLKEFHHFNSSKGTQAHWAPPLGPPRVTRNWGKYNFSYMNNAISDWNSSDDEVITYDNLANLSQTVFILIDFSIRNYFCNYNDNINTLASFFRYLT